MGGRGESTKKSATLFGSGMNFDTCGTKCFGIGLNLPPWKNRLTPNRINHTNANKKKKGKKEKIRNIKVAKL